LYGLLQGGENGKEAVNAHLVFILFLAVAKQRQERGRSEDC